MQNYTLQVTYSLMNFAVAIAAFTIRLPQLVDLHRRREECIQKWTTEFTPEQFSDGAVGSRHQQHGETSQRDVGYEQWKRRYVLTYVLNLHKHSHLTRFALMLLTFAI